MRKLFLISFLTVSITSFCQTHKDSLQFLQQTATLFDLNFTEAEADSLQGNILFYKSIYQRMHRELPKNDLVFPLAFNPAPYGFSIPTKQQKIVWDLPVNVSVPANKNDLAFYSVSQLASLIKNKRLTSLELTTFFLDRLKNGVIHLSVLSL